MIIHPAYFSLGRLRPPIMQHERLLFFSELHIEGLELDADTTPLWDLSYADPPHST